MLVLGRNGDSDLVSFTPSPSPCVYVSVSSRVKKSKSVTLEHATGGLVSKQDDIGLSQPTHGS